MNATTPLKRGVVEQRVDSLGRANAVRSARAELKRELACGKVEIENVISQPPAFAEQAKVDDLLLAVRGLGPVRTAGLLLRSQIPPGKTLINLSARQRDALVTLLQQHEDKKARRAAGRLFVAQQAFPTVAATRDAADSPSEPTLTVHVDAP